MNDIELIKKALKAREQSYCPYSGFSVGAALLDDNDNVFTGCNIENAAYSPSICAERTAIFKAVSEGSTYFKKIAIVGGKRDSVSLDACSPCGVCRQVMSEFVDAEKFEILLPDILNTECTHDTDIILHKFTLNDLLPLSFALKQN